MSLVTQAHCTFYTLDRHLRPTQSIDCVSRLFFHIRNILKLLKIVKVIKKFQPQLTFLSTAILKTIVFYMSDQYPNQSQWTGQQELALRYVNP